MAPLTMIMTPDTLTVRGIGFGAFGSMSGADRGVSADRSMSPNLGRLDPSLVLMDANLPVRTERSGQERGGRAAPDQRRLGVRRGGGSAPWLRSTSACEASAA